MPDTRRQTLMLQRQKRNGKLTPSTDMLLDGPSLKVNRLQERSASEIARLCRYQLDACERCLRSLVQHLHPGDSLKTHLAQSDTNRTLRRLKIKGMLSDSDWLVLYPADKSLVSADNYSLPLLLLVAKYACGIEQPQPDGWSGDPEPTDRGQAAAIQRLLKLQRDLAGLSVITSSAAGKMFRRIADQLELLLLPVEAKFEERQLMEAAKLAEFDEAQMDEIFAEFLEWYTRELTQARIERDSQLRKRRRAGDIPLLQQQLLTRELDASDVTRRQSIVGKGGAAGESGEARRWSHIKTGMVAEERRILEKYYDRLIEEVKADGVVEYLTARGIITSDESTDVFATLRNNEQMSTLIELLVRKSGNFFDEFLDSFRLRNDQLYYKIHQDYLAARNDILANKPQALPYCHSKLKEQYKTASSKWNPIPWYPGTETDISDFYCQQQVLNLLGKPIDPLRIFEAAGGEKEPMTVVIEGDPGTGKSTLAKYIACKWAEDQSIFGRDFKLLLLLDLKMTAPNIKAMIMEQLFTTDCKMADREIWETVEQHQDKTLLILDGYEDNLNDEMRSLLFERTMPELRVLVLSQTNFTVRLVRRYQRKVIVTGFAKGQAEDYVQKYVRLAKKPKEHFAEFLEKLASSKQKTSDTQKLMESLIKLGGAGEKRRNSSGSVGSGLPTQDERSLEKQNSKLSKSSAKVLSESQQQEQQQQQQQQSQGANKSKIASLRHYSQVPLYCSFFCLLTDMRMSIELNSPTTIVEQFVSCVKLKLIERDKESRFEANRASVILSELAMDTMKQGSATFLLQDSENLLTKFGLIQRATNTIAATNSNDTSHRYMFRNRLIQEYLAARHLDTAGTDEASRFFQSMSMTPSSYNVVVFYCSLRKSDNDTAATRELFTKILQYNKRRAKAAQMKLSAPVLPGDQSQLLEGKIMDYQLSLECVAVIDFMRKDLSKNISKSLPERFIVKHEGIIPRLSLTGLSKIIRLNYDTIKEVDLRLDLLAKETLEAYSSLAVAIKYNKHIVTLRIYWTEKDLMANFLKEICCTDPEEQQKQLQQQQKRTSLINRKVSMAASTGRCLQNLECIDESSRRHDPLTPKVLSNIRDACSSMTQLRTFAFQNCQHQALVGTIIKNLPMRTAEGLTALDFSGCELSMIASQDLNVKLVDSKSLQQLVLANLRIDAMAFNAFIEAFSSNRTVVQLDLSGIRMDKVCFFSLSEALKINNKLDRLSLRNVAMDARACSELARIIKINKFLKLIEVTEESVVEEGRRILGDECQTEVRKNRPHVDGISRHYKVRLTVSRSNTKA